jgi:hypothetical protein
LSSDNAFEQVAQREVGFCPAEGKARPGRRSRAATWRRCRP